MKVERWQALGSKWRNLGLLDTRRGTAYTREGADETWICMDSFGKGAEASRTGNGDKMASKATVTATNENCGLISMVLQKTGK